METHSTKAGLTLIVNSASLVRSGECVTFGSHINFDQMPVVQRAFLTAYFMLVMAPIFGQIDSINGIKYGLSLNRFEVGSTSSLIVRCDEGIDSIIPHFDTAMLKWTVSYYNIVGTKTNLPQKGTVAQLFEIVPKKAGNLVLGELDVWVNGLSNIISFKEPFVVKPTSPEETAFPIESLFNKYPNASDFKHRVKGKRAKASIWFEKDEYYLGETVFLYITANRADLKQPISPIESIPSLKARKARSTSLINGKISEYSLLTYEFVAIKQGILQTEKLNIELDGKTLKLKPTSCLVR